MKIAKFNIFHPDVKNIQFIRPISLFSSLKFSSDVQIWNLYVKRWDILKISHV